VDGTIGVRVPADFDDDGDVDFWDWMLFCSAYGTNAD
jgi:hypothetical protein